MKKTLNYSNHIGRRLCAVAAAVLLGTTSSWAQAISVSAGGAGPLTFDALPTPADGWSTLRIGAGAGTHTTDSALDTDVIAATDASLVTTQLGSSTTQPPSENAIARWNGGGFYLQTRATSVDYLILMATLRNDSGVDQSGLTVSYDWNQRNANPVNESIPGHRAFYSLTGLPGSWVLIPEFSTFTTSSTAQNLVASLPLGNWVAGSLLYIIWVDDNGPGSTTNPMEGAYTIDNFQVAFGAINIPLSVTLNTPAAGVTYLTTSAGNTANAQLTATTVGTTPADSVDFYVNGVFFATDTTAPYSNQLVNLPIGTYTVYAFAQNAIESDYSATNTIVVRDEFVHFSGTAISENFDGITATGTQTPIGWYAGTTSPFNTVSLVVSNGDHRPIGTAAAFNMGTTGDGDRALAVQATGGDRSIVVRIQNNTSSSFTSVTLNYDGELWRPYTNDQHSLINEVSVDGGATWTPTGFDFQQPVPIAQPPGSVPPTALDGNLSENRVSGIGGNTFLPTPVAPNGVLYIRWLDVNEGGDDGVLGIDNFTFSATLDVFTPTVTITAPETESQFAFLTAFTISAVPSMANPVTNVTFYADNLSTIIGTDTNSPFSISVSNLSVGTHSLFVIAQDNSGVRATNTANVSVIIAENVLPSITITNPAAGSEYLVGTMVTNVSAAPTDSDGSIVRVEFFLDGVLFATDTTSAYGFDLVNITAGAHTIAAVAVDNANGRATNTISITATNPPGISVIVPNGSDWKYLDTGVDPGAGWQTAGYNDSAWLTGFGELGYGDGPGRPERTLISFGPNANQKYAATYFRKTFNVANPAAVSSLIVRVLKDDHAVVYLNGTQVFSDMTNAVITFQTFEQPAISHDGTVYEEATALSSLLVAGVNVLAVEVHQDSTTSSDLGFDLMLWGVGGAPAGPMLTITQSSPTQVTISWGADATGFRLQGNTDIANPAGWTTVQTITGAGQTTLNTTGTARFFRLINP